LTANPTEQLWEDNWDDDDVEDDFQKQLRQAIAERAGGDAEMKD
jgi:26 proteasome complex subunit DSS1